MRGGPVRLAILSAVMTLGAIGATLAALGLGVPLVAAALVAAAAAGAVQYAALRAATPPPAAPAAPLPDPVLTRQLQAYREHAAVLRHDLRGVLSPALLMSDRLVNHADPAVQRAGTAVVRSIDRATTLLAGSRDLMAADPEGQPTPPLG